MLKKIVIFSSVILIILITTLFLWKSFKSAIEIDSTEIAITNNIIIEKIESIGKLEVVKFYIKDILEHTEIKQWWPDPKVILLISGEVVGCIDLKKMDSSSIIILEHTVKIKLPQPEICYTKINHQDSRVYHLENEIFDQSGLVDKAYKMAEGQLYNAAMKMKIFEQTRINAEVILKPMIENMTNKKVEFIN